MSVFNFFLNNTLYTLAIFVAIRCYSTPYKKAYFFHVQIYFLHNVDI